jgi:hypothetical protein
LSCAGDQDRGNYRTSDSPVSMNGSQIEKILKHTK